MIRSSFVFRHWLTQAAEHGRNFCQPATRAFTRVICMPGGLNVHGHTGIAAAVGAGR